MRLTTFCGSVRKEMFSAQRLKLLQALDRRNGLPGTSIDASKAYNRLKEIAELESSATVRRWLDVLISRKRQGEPLIRDT